MTDIVNALPWPSQTPRLTIRPATVDDGEATWEFRRMESVTEWITSAASNRESFLRQFVEPERLARTLVIERDGVVIGDLMLLIQNGCYYGDLSLFHWRGGQSWVGHIRAIQILPPGTDPNAYPASGQKVIGQCQ